MFIIFSICYSYFLSIKLFSLGIKNLSAADADRLASSDPDYSIRFVVLSSSQIHYRHHHHHLYDQKHSYLHNHNTIIIIESSLSSTELSSSQTWKHYNYHHPLRLHRVSSDQSSLLIIIITITEISSMPLSRRHFPLGLSTCKWWPSTKHRHAHSILSIWRR